MLLPQIEQRMKKLPPVNASRPDLMPTQEQMNSVSGRLGDVRTMSDDNLTKFASADAKQTGVSDFTPEKRAMWAQLDNEFAAEKIRRKQEKEKEKWTAYQINSLGNNVKYGITTPEIASETMSKHGITIAPDYFAEYLPTHRGADTHPLAELRADYEARKLFKAQTEQTLQTGLPSNVLPKDVSIILKNRAETAKLQKETANIGVLPQLNPLQEAQRKEAEARTGQIGKEKPIVLSPEQSLYPAGGGEPIIKGTPKPEKLPSPNEQLTQKRLDELNRIESMPEKDRSKEEMATLRKLKTGMSTDTELTTATELRKEFNSSQVLKNFQTIQYSEQAITAAYNMSISSDTESRIASDQALGVAFQKMLDPQSVVRESEYARTPQGAALLNRIDNYIPKLLKGGLAIADSDRKALYDMAQQLLGEAKRSMNRHISRYTKLSNDYGVRPELVLGDIEPFVVNSENDPLGIR